ncbi:uncharacterized protein F5147DRAFT_237275 [Suillus discolor]|uniref:Uncharacterized protein n=1 Tax=Suillus discolor TaxID=1912936 RepID=A0A9P7JSN9_9AGAM|nr:uncharacterized protein F5147DRAFT_237275 [Suillus discolor]KAG2105784.1 hypothetical protein F5147DRAFT_237275 [Suillus discolor]
MAFTRSPSKLSCTNTDIRAPKRTTTVNTSLSMSYLTHSLPPHLQTPTHQKAEDPPLSSSPCPMTPGDYHKEYFKDDGVHADAGDEGSTMYSGSAPATWRLGSTIRSRTSATADMESVARAREDGLIPLTSATRKDRSKTRDDHQLRNTNYIIPHYNFVVQQDVTVGHMYLQY